jgi:hypothetical protein
MPVTPSGIETATFRLEEKCRKYEKCEIIAGKYPVSVFNWILINN